MKWNTVEISKMSDDELWVAIQSVADIDNNRFEKLANPRKRHIKLFEKHPPIENPVFTNLVNELNSEFNRRKL